MMTDALKLMLVLEYYVVLFFYDITGTTALKCYNCIHHATMDQYVLSRGITGTASSKYCDEPASNQSMISTCFVPLNTDPKYQCAMYTATHPLTQIKVIVRECVPTAPTFIRSIHVRCNRPGTVQDVELNGEIYQTIAKCCNADGCNVEKLSFTPPTPDPTATDDKSAAMSVFRPISLAYYAVILIGLVLV